MQATSATASQIQAAPSTVSGFSARHPGQQPEPATTQHDHNRRDGRAREQRLHQPSQHPADIQQLGVDAAQVIEKRGGKLAEGGLHGPGRRPSGEAGSRR